MKFEEVLPALRKGYKIRDKEWPKDDHIYNKDNFLYNQQGCLVHLSSFGLLAGDWEIVEEPESTYDWDYIIKNKCLCWFGVIGKEKQKLGTIKHMARFEECFVYYINDNEGFSACRPVLKDEITFYEDRKND